ncbi:MAG: hypothetical protein ACYDHU_05970 [Acidimicrobiales bacterium]
MALRTPLRFPDREENAAVTPVDPTRVDPTRVDRVSALRGAGVAEVDMHRVVRALGIAGMVAVIVVSAVLFVAGARRNAQITNVRQHGVPVTVTVSGCLGLLGGSGSNKAGYACRGTYSLGGHRYNEAIPGETLYPPGTTITAVAVPSDPGLLATVRSAATEHPSASVFVLPAVLLTLLTVLGVVVFVRRRRAGTKRVQGPRSTVLRATADLGAAGSVDQPASRSSPSGLGS